MAVTAGTVGHGRRREGGYWKRLLSGHSATLCRLPCNELAICGSGGLHTQYMAKRDHIDDCILRELGRDGRLSNLSLAERVGLSPSACLRRVQELERSGVIRGYRAVLDRVAMQAGFTAYIAVGLATQAKATQTAFEQAMQRASEVRECHNITGTVEYLLRVEVADLRAYKAFHTEVLGTLDQVRALTSYIVLDSPKDERA